MSLFWCQGDKFYFSYLLNKFIACFCFCTSHLLGKTAPKDPQIYLPSFKGFLKSVLQHLQNADKCLCTWPMLITSASSCFLTSAVSVNQFYYFLHLDCNISGRGTVTFFSATMGWDPYVDAVRVLVR